MWLRGSLPRAAEAPPPAAIATMQLTITQSPVDEIDLVLAAWSEAAPAIDAELENLHPADLDELEAQLQLQLRLNDEQIPLWDQRAADAR